jgi:hypothetical protein
MNSNWIHDPSGQNSGVALEQILDVNLCRRFPSTPDEFGPETSSIGKSLKLSFYPYKEHPNPTPYATWASVLVWAVPGVRN